MLPKGARSDCHMAWPGIGQRLTAQKPTTHVVSDGPYMVSNGPHLISDGPHMVTDGSYMVPGGACMVHDGP